MIKMTHLRVCILKTKEIGGYKMAYPQLKDQQLIEAYINSIKLKLDKEFVSLLKNEINRRKLDIPLLKLK